MPLLGHSTHEPDAAAVSPAFPDVQTLLLVCITILLLLDILLLAQVLSSSSMLLLVTAEMCSDAAA